MFRETCYQDIVAVFEKQEIRILDGILQSHRLYLWSKHYSGQQVFSLSQTTTKQLKDYFFLTPNVL